MPDWEPNWNDVDWDHAAAQEAARELDRTANLLEESKHRRRQLANEARVEWRGRCRDEFDGRLTKTLHRAAELAAQLRAKASEIRDADRRAHAEQRRREQERERWWHEKRMEERQAEQ
jgi:hypothetical protein